MSSMTEEEFKKLYGNLSDEELEAYGGMIFRQMQEAEQINKKKKENQDRQVGESSKEDKRR